MAYVFDRVQNQPLVTVVGRDEDDELDEMTLSEPADSRKQGNVEVEIPEGAIGSNNSRQIGDGARTPYRDQVHDDKGLIVPHKSPDCNGAPSFRDDPHDGHYRDVNLDDEITGNDNTLQQQGSVCPQYEVASKEIV
jgi:hypothetical protein